MNGFTHDDDYVDRDEQRADVDLDSAALDEHERDPQFLPAPEQFDHSHTYGRSDNGMSGTEYDVVIDRRPVTDRDDRGGTRTGMDIREAEGFYAERIYRDGKERSRAEWLNVLQDGHRSPQRDVENKQADNYRWIDTFTARFDMNPYQKERVQAIIDSVNLKHFGPYTAEMTILGAVTLVANEDDRWIRDERTYKELVAALDASEHSIDNIRDLLKEKSDLF